jgi:hypothetical protein
MFEKLATRMAHMKRDFLLVKLQHNCANCHEYIISGNRFSCDECARQGKPFNLCQACHEAEERRMAVVDEGESMEVEGEEGEEEEAKKAKKSLHRSRVE